MTAKVRPALVMSVRLVTTDRALVTRIPHTTSLREFRFEVAVSTPVLRAGVFDAQNVITIPHAKLIRRLGQLKAAQMADVERAVCLWLGLPGERRLEGPALPLSTRTATGSSSVMQDDARIDRHRATRAA